MATKYPVFFFAFTQIVLYKTWHTREVFNRFYLKIVGPIEVY